MLLRVGWSGMVMRSFKSGRQRDAASCAFPCHSGIPYAIVQGCVLKDPVDVVHVPAPGFHPEESPMPKPAQYCNCQRCSSNKQRGHDVPF